MGKSLRTSPYLGSNISPSKKILEKNSRKNTVPLQRIDFPTFGDFNSLKYTYRTSPSYVRASANKKIISSSHYSGKKNSICLSLCQSFLSNFSVKFFLPVRARAKIFHFLSVQYCLCRSGSGGYTYTYY